jgi:3-phosphoshikimate 1-carboxyvinyltransferase
VDGRNSAGGIVKVDCGKSSQFLSALLLMAPRLENGLRIQVTRGPVSRPYIDMTLGVMNHFGIEVLRSGYNEFHVPGKQQYHAESYEVEPDYSQAGYFWAAAAISGRSVKVLGTRPDTLQGDSGLLALLEKMGCTVSPHPDGIEVIGKSLSGIETDMSDMPDMVPTLAVVAAFAEGETRIQNVGHLKIKESDRLASVVKELNRLGIKAFSGGNDLVIRGGNSVAGRVRTYDDHRIAMSFSLFGLRTPGIEIENERCVDKSFPNYWEAFEGLFRR